MNKSLLFTLIFGLLIISASFAATESVEVDGAKMRVTFVGTPSEFKKMCDESKYTCHYETIGNNSHVRVEGDVKSFMNDKNMNFDFQGAVVTDDGKLSIQANVDVQRIFNQLMGMLKNLNFHFNFKFFGNEFDFSMKNGKFSMSASGNEKTNFGISIDTAEFKFDSEDINVDANGYFTFSNQYQNRYCVLLDVEGKEKDLCGNFAIEPDENGEIKAIIFDDETTYYTAKLNVKNPQKTGNVIIEPDDDALDGNVYTIKFDSAQNETCIVAVDKARIRLMSWEQPCDGEHRLDTSSWPSGTYIVSIESKKTGTRGYSIIKIENEYEDMFHYTIKDNIFYLTSLLNENIEYEVLITTVQTKAILYRHRDNVKEFILSLAPYKEPVYISVSGFDKDNIKRYETSFVYAPSQRSRQMFFCSRDNRFYLDNSIGCIDVNEPCGKDYCICKNENNNVCGLGQTCTKNKCLKNIKSDKCRTKNCLHQDGVCVDESCMCTIDNTIIDTCRQNEKCLRSGCEPFNFDIRLLDYTAQIRRFHDKNVVFAFKTQNNVGQVTTATLNGVATKKYTLKPEGPEMFNVFIPLDGLYLMPGDLSVSIVITNGKDSQKFTKLVKVLYGLNEKIEPSIRRITPEKVYVDDFTKTIFEIDVDIKLNEGRAFSNVAVSDTFVAFYHNKEFQGSGKILGLEKTFSGIRLFVSPEKAVEKDKLYTVQCGISVEDFMPVFAEKDIFITAEKEDQCHLLNVEGNLGDVAAPIYETYLQNGVDLRFRVRKYGACDDVREDKSAVELIFGSYDISDSVDSVYVNSDFIVITTKGTKLSDTSAYTQREQYVPFTIKVGPYTKERSLLVRPNPGGWV